MMLSKTIKSAHGGNITAVVPCLPYSRQDQSYGKRQLVTARFIGEMFEEASISHVITIGLHSPQIEGYHQSIDHLKTRPIFSHYLQNRARDRLIQHVRPTTAENIQGIDFYRK